MSNFFSTNVKINYDKNTSVGYRKTKNYENLNYVAKRSRNCRRQRRIGALNQGDTFAMCTYTVYALQIAHCKFAGTHYTL